MSVVFNFAFVFYTFAGVFLVQSVSCIWSKVLLKVSLLLNMTVGCEAKPIPWTVILQVLLDINLMVNSHYSMAIVSCRLL